MTFNYILQTKGWLKRPLLVPSKAKQAKEQESQPNPQKEKDKYENVSHMINATSSPPQEEIQTEQGGGKGNQEEEEMNKAHK